MASSRRTKTLSEVAYAQRRLLAPHIGGVGGGCFF